MRSIDRGDGVQLVLPDHVQVGRAPDPETKRRGPPGRLRGPIPIDELTETIDRDPIVAAMLGQEMQLVDQTELYGVATTGRRVVIAPEAPPAVLATVDENEDVAVLFEKDGVYSWGVRRQNTIERAQRRGVGNAQRTIVIEAPAALLNVGASAEDRAFPGLGVLVGKARVWILKFAAPVILGTGVRLLERHVHKRILSISSADPSTWPEIESLPSLPTDRAPRILMFVHGTFSSTVGSYGALAASPWGREFLDAAVEQYDAVIGYDHPTLSEDPLENAVDLLARLERLGIERPARIHAVAFSRGALVLRSLAEHLLQRYPHIGRVERAVFVGSTNAGTELARAENWSRLVDLYTNLAMVAFKAIELFGSAGIAAKILEESIRTLGALVKVLSDSAVSDKKVPGLAAMAPDGDFVAEINKAQPGQPSPAEVFYSVVTSDFDVSLANKAPETSIPAHLLQWMIDTVGDQLMGKPNDLVVHIASMDSIDTDLGNYVKARYDFGTNPYVYHTVYFTRPETVSHIREQLGIAEPRGTARRSNARSAVWAPTGDAVIEVRDTDSVNTVLSRIGIEQPRWVVVSRSDMPAEFQYAFSSAEILRVVRTSPIDATVRQTLDSDPDLELHEDGQSKRKDTSGASNNGGGGPRVTAQRTIELDAGRVTGVIDGATGLLSHDELARRARRGAPVGKSVQESGRRAVRSLDIDFSGPITYRGIQESLTEKAGFAPAPTAAMQECHVGASMPGLVAAGATVDVDVSLSLDDLQLPAEGIGAIASGQVDVEHMIEVMVIPKARFAVASDRVESVTLKGPRRTSRFTFAVTATEPGPGELWVEATQAGRPVARVAMTPQVVTGAPAKAPAIGGIDVKPVTPGGPSDSLQIYQNVRADDDWDLFFVLTLSGRRVPIRGRTGKITRSPDAFIKTLYEEIEKNYPRTPVGQALARDKVTMFGERLLKDLIPDNIRDALWQNRDRIRGIQLFSEDTLIPWELVCLIPPRKGLEPRPDGVFLGELGLVRWLLDTEVDPPAEVSLANAEAFYLIPDYPLTKWQLPAAQGEIPLLKSLFGAKAMTPSTSGDIIGFLKQPDRMSFFHFSGHGLAPTEEEETKGDDAVMVLAGTVAGGKYEPDYLPAGLVETVAQLSSGPNGRRPIVTLNACQLGRTTRGLRSTGGFTPAFIGAGAGIFTAALWSIGDEPARAFSEALYDSLVKKRKTLAEAVRDGRAAARIKEPDTWLSYAVYGHPDARVTT